MPTQKGFTLIELLVTFSIIAILAVIGVAVFSGVQNSARINSTKEELRRLQQAMVRYKISDGELPPTGVSCPACYPDRDVLLRNEPLATLASSSNGGPYISNLEDFVYDAWGEAYWYDDNDEGISGGATGPCQGNLATENSALYSSGPDKTNNTSDDIHFDIRCP